MVMAWIMSQPKQISYQITWSARTLRKQNRIFQPLLRVAEHPKADKCADRKQTRQNNNMQHNQINSFAALRLSWEQGMQLGQCTFTKSTIWEANWAHLGCYEK